VVDAFLRRPDQLAVVIGDDFGHDIAAAAVMGSLKLRSPWPPDRLCCSTPTAWSNVAAVP